MTAPRISIKELDRLHKSALDWQAFAEAASRDWPAISRALKAGKALEDAFGDPMPAKWDKALPELVATMEAFDE